MFKTKTLRKITVILMLFLIRGEILAQNNKVPDLIGPSPNATAFDKYGNIPVGYYTGVPDIEIPLYTIKNKKISLPITIRYHAGGIKVNEEAGRIGLGWVLNCGGVINRQVKYIDDFRPQFGYKNNNGPEFFDPSANSYFKSRAGYINTPASDGRSEGVSVTPWKRIIADREVDLTSLVFNGDKVPNANDLEPDVFSYSFMGHSGRFVIKKNKEVIKETPDNLDIELLANDGSAFQITDGQGIKYIFSTTEKCTLYDGNSEYIPNYITSWYLTKIVSPTLAAIDFHYSLIENTLIQSLSSWEENVWVSSTKVQEIGVSPQSEILPVTIQSSESNPQLHTSIYLDSITFPFGSVSFNYADRLDIKGDKRLTQIDIHNLSSAYNMSFMFIEDYFTANSSENERYYPPEQANFVKKRLKLTDVIQMDHSHSQNAKYQFKYEENYLPSKRSYARDHWGYYNGADNGSLIPALNLPVYISGSYNAANREPNPNFTQAFILKEITYPTNGKRQFFYESNDYDIGGSLNASSIFSNLSIKKGTYSGISSIGQPDIIQPVHIDQFSPSLYSIQLKMDSQNGIAPQPVNYQQADDAFIEFYKDSSLQPSLHIPLGFSSLWALNGSHYVYTQDISLGSGNYNIKMHFGTNATFLKFISISLNWFFNDNNVDNHNIAIGPGLRISKIATLDGFSNNVKVKRFVYRKDTLKGKAGSFSTGKLLSQLKYDYHNYKQYCTINPDPNSAYTLPAFDEYFIYSQAALPSDHPLIAYDRVIELNGENGQDGKSEFDFFNEPYTQLIFNGPIVDFNPPTSPFLYNLENGLSNEKRHYKYINPSLFELVEKEKDSFSIGLTSALVGIQRISLVYQIALGGCNVPPYAWRLAEYPSFQTQSNFLVKKIKQKYDKNTIAMTEETNYTYEKIPKHFNPIQIMRTSSENEKKYTYFTYCTDYKSGVPFIDSMVTHHMVDVPIETVEVKEDFGGIKYILKGSLNKFHPSFVSQVDTVLATEFSKLVPSSGFKFSNTQSGQLPSGDNASFQLFQNDNEYHKKIIINRFDIHGNILEQQRPNNVKETYLWAYNGQYPVAKIIGSDYTTVNGIISQMTIDAATNIPNNDAKVRSLLNQIRDYFKFNPEVQVFTYTYTPLIGMTSETSTSGNILFYEYDNFGRLKVVKDKNGKIIKIYDYHYLGQ